MCRVFISFLGIGSPQKDPGYDLASYNWPGKSDTPVRVHFAQTAILKILADTGEPVDKAIFLCTKESKDRHLELLKDEVLEHWPSCPVCSVPEPLVPTEMTAANQWGWFERVLGLVEHGDTLIIDFTHGMRAVPIVLSSAIGFLQRAKEIHLAHALYAWYDTADKDKVHPIIDMRDFYAINDWTEAVARLADDADVRKLADLAKETKVEALQPLADKELIKALQEMTDCIRNVDVNNVGKKVSAALDLVRQAQNRNTAAARVMLDLVWEKFSGLATDFPPSGRYDHAYFKSQLEIIKVLLEHRLFMQAFTAMRELIGSIGMAGLRGKYGKQMSCDDGRKYRRRFAEVFVDMMQFAQDDWKFKGLKETDKETLLPWFNTLRQAGVEPKLRSIAKPMIDTRNGFDHAWTAKVGAGNNVEQDGKDYFNALEEIIQQLHAKGCLD